MTVVHSATEKPVRSLGAGFAAEADLSGADRTELKLWSEFAEAGSFSAYCRAWLALQCRAIPTAKAGLLLLEEKGSFVPAAIWPEPRRDIGYLKSAAKKALTERKGVVLRGAGGESDVSAAKDVHIGYPVVVLGTLYGAVVVHAEPGGGELQGVLRHLHWGVGWLEALFWRLRSEEDKARLERAAVALDVVVVTQEQAKLRAAAIACVNELARRLECDRVAIGWRHGYDIRVKAVSHMSKVEKKAQFSAALENAMDEALDQNTSLCYPVIPSEPRRVGIALEAFAKLNGFASAASVVMPARDDAFGVITFMRAKGEPFDAGTMRLAEAVAGLVGPVIEQKHREHRLFAGRAVDSVGAFVRALFGKRHPTLKIAALAAAAAITWLATATGSFNISAKSVVEGAVQRAAVSPFDGYLANAFARAGDVVKAGDVLAVLDDKDLKLERLKWQIEKDKALQKSREALAEHDRAAIAVYSAQARQAESQLNLANEVLSRTRVTAPLDGFVVSGDLSQMLGAPVERGKVLFEIAPLSSYRVVLQVDERDIQYVEVGQRGTFSPTGLPDAKFGLTVANITSIASAEEGLNTFRVEAKVGAAEKLRPGMEGVVRLDAGRGKLGWIWTRGLVDWLKLTWWRWKPL